MKKHTVAENTEIDQNISLERMMILRAKGLTYEDIGQIVKCGKQNVQQRLEDFSDFPEFKSEIDNWYEALQFRAYKAIDNEKLAKLNAYQLTLIMSILEDKKRLVRGQATQKIDINNIHKSIQDIQSKERILEARYKLLTGKELGAAT